MRGGRRKGRDSSRPLSHLEERNPGRPETVSTSHPIRGAQCVAQVCPVGPGCRVHPVADAQPCGHTWKGQDRLDHQVLAELPEAGVWWLTHPHRVQTSFPLSRVSDPRGSTSFKQQCSPKTKQEGTCGSTPLVRFLAQ